MFRLQQKSYSQLLRWISIRYREALFSKNLNWGLEIERGSMRKPAIKIESTVFTQHYENQKHLEFGPELPKTPPLENPALFLGRIASAINEVILGTRPVDQLSMVLNEHVFESLRTRSAARAQLRIRERKQIVVQPTNVLRVRYQSPAEDVIESVVLLSSRQRAKAITIRLEGLNGSWRATNIGFL